jgi:hypothetical protein
MTQHPDTTDSPLAQFIRMSAWLGVGIWTTAFLYVYLQLWLQS